MPDDMETFRVEVEIENPARPGERRTLTSVLVDTGAELSWVPAQALESLGIERYTKWHFRQADGTILERWAGGAFIYVTGKRRRIRRARRPCVGSPSPRVGACQI